MSSLGITAIVTAYERVSQTLKTIRKIQSCDPPVDEILVHVDANQKVCEASIRQAFPNVRIMTSEERVGPGGGRNRLMHAATTEYVASFDDDSYPVDSDYFKRAIELFKRFPDASVVGASLYHRGEMMPEATPSAEWTADFSGGACVYRRAAFMETGGYVPLPVAYGMEESDLALRIHAHGGRILTTRWLRVFHDTDLQRHGDADVTANSIANIALLAYLRYPIALWFIGLGQCVNRVFWLITHRRYRGLLTGVLMIPSHLRAYRHYRSELSRESIKSYRALRRAPQAQTI